jgi:hypothetical protein
MGGLPGSLEIMKLFKLPAQAACICKCYKNFIFLIAAAKNNLRVHPS